MSPAYITPDNPTFSLLLAVEHSNYYHREPLEKSLARMADALQVKTPKALTQRVQAWDAEIKAVATATGTH